VNVGTVSIDATQMVGMAGFGLAAFSCARQSQTKAAWSNSAHWRILAVVSAVLVIEIVAGLRYRVHDFADMLLLSQSLYEARRPWQLAMIVVALTALITAAWMARTRVQSAATASAAMGVCFAVSIFVIEAISLHAVDAVLYRALGPVKVIALFWLAASAWISLAAFKSPRGAAR
jgi:succinate dehydrogenase/fumarate reductase cytochrome b subunit